MWPPSEWEMRDALDLATPEQRQQVIQSGGKPAEIANRLNLAENITRTKLQTPPPPQGTVMNQYYQWPQQQQQMGLAQPGLEQMAQQYAAGGLVAFADGGSVYGDEDNMLFNTDGSYGYAEGGLASMLPMGYAGEDDVPVFNGYADGGGVLKSVFPTTFDEDEYDEGEGENFGDVGSGVYGLSEKDLARDIRAKDIVQEREDAKRKIAAREANRQFVTEDISDWATRPIGGARVADPVAKAQKEYEALKGPVPDRNKPSEPSFSDKAGQVFDAFAGLLRGNTESGEDRKQKETVAAKSATKAAEVAAMEKPTRARKASVSVPSANPVRSEGPGISVLSPQSWGGGPLGSTAGYEPSTEMVEAPTGEQESTVNLNPNNNATAAAIVNSPLSADQQIAALAKYFQTDTSEAMRIKGEMEKENAHAGNVGIMAVLANALGMGLGTYGTGTARWGAGLMGAAQGFMSEEDRAARRQEKINELGLKVKEMEGSGTRKAAELVLNQRAKAAAEADELKKAMLLERMKAGSAMNVANVRKAGQTEAAQISADARRATQGAGGMNEYQRKQIEAKAVELGMKDYETAIKGKQPDENLKNRLIAKYYQQLLNSVPIGGSVGMGGGSVTPDLVIGRIQGGQFVQ